MLADKSAERHIASLDGLRGCAVLMVYLFHAVGSGPPDQSSLVRAIHQIALWGFAGVDLFFVLSGFLITRILIRTRESTNFYRVFYFRRVLRIFPLYYFALILVFFVLPGLTRVSPSLGLYTHAVPLSDQLWFWFNFSNLKTAFNPLLVPLLVHFWSLAIEEQFYFLWPSIVRRVRGSFLAWICASGFILPLILRISGVIPTFGAPDFHYRITLFHMEGLFGGASIATLSAGGNLGPRKNWLFVAIAVASVGIGCLTRWPNSKLAFHSMYTLLALGFTGLVGLCVLDDTQSFGLARLLTFPPLRSLGNCSYFIYVFHITALGYAREMSSYLHHRPLFSDHNHLLQLMTILLPLLLLYGSGLLSKRFFEGPILRLKEHLPYSFEYG
jgi:peptidoglycan/LPS O-acetylase OafA/YrhL